MKLNSKIKLIFLTAALNLLCLSAQTSKSPFETFGIGLNLDQNLNREEFHSFWNPKTGAGLFFETPFYLGEIAIGLKYMPFNSINKEQPDFTSLYYYFRWNAGLHLFDRFRINAVLNIGLFEMDFDGIEFESDELEVEREFTAGLGFQFDYRVSDRLTLRIGTDYNTVFTRKQIRLLNLSGGAVYYFDSPEWLRDFLK